MAILNTVPKDKQESFIKLLQAMVSKHGYKGTAKITGISAGHVHKLVNLAEHDLLIATGKKILAGYKISKHL